MNQRLTKKGKLLEELEDWLSLMKSLEQELELRDVSVADSEGLDELIAILGAARAKAEQEAHRLELLFEESLPHEYISWLAALPSSFEFLWKARRAS